jgi:hypothetical protein
MGVTVCTTVSIGTNTYRYCFFNSAVVFIGISIFNVNRLIFIYLIVPVFQFLSQLSSTADQSLVTSDTVTRNN